jgi:hypothetical protein
VRARAWRLTPAAWDTARVAGSEFLPDSYLPDALRIIVERFCCCALS